MMAMNTMQDNALQMPPEWGSFNGDMAPRPMDSMNQYTPSNSHPTSRFAYSIHDPKLGDPMPSIPYRNFGPNANPVQYTKSKISTKPFT
jgi:hypothetical protein